MGGHAPTKPSKWDSFGGDWGQVGYDSGPLKEGTPLGMAPRYRRDLVDPLMLPIPQNENPLQTNTPSTRDSPRGIPFTASSVHVTVHLRYVTSRGETKRCTAAGHVTHHRVPDRTAR